MAIKFVPSIQLLSCIQTSTKWRSRDVLIARFLNTIGQCNVNSKYLPFLVSCQIRTRGFPLKAWQTRTFAPHFRVFESWIELNLIRYRGQIVFPSKFTNLQLILSWSYRTGWYHALWSTWLFKELKTNRNGSLLHAVWLFTKMLTLCPVSYFYTLFLRRECVTMQYQTSTQCSTW